MPGARGAPGPQAGPAPRTSIVVVSRHRPQALARCLTALTRQTHPDYEIVLIADPEAIGTCPELPLKRRALDLANISAARNAGIALAAGEVVAFIDDDALAMPDWARALTAPFADPRVLAATGFTRGPDGLGWQARAERMSASGQALPMALAESALLAVSDGMPVSTIGTNCAFRRAALVEIGGFDPAFAYHLDESDVNMRMAARFPAMLTAVQPHAQVIHGIAAGTGRGADRVPWDLTQIGRSAAIFAARHGGTLDWTRHSQRRRLLRHMVAGRLDPFAVAPLLASLERGMAEGAGAEGAGVQAADPAQAKDLPAPPDFLPLPGRAPGHVALAGWHWQARRLRAQAARAVADQGALVSLLLLTPGVLRHRLVLTPGGWWEQRGGIWGPSRPGDRPVMVFGPAARARREAGNLLDLPVK